MPDAEAPSSQRVPVSSSKSLHAPGGKSRLRDIPEAAAKSVKPVADPVELLGETNGGVKVDAVDSRM